MGKSTVPDYRAGKPKVLKEQVARQKDYKDAVKTLDEGIKRCDEVAARLDEKSAEIDGYFQQMEASHVRLAAYANNMITIRDKAAANFLRKPDPKILEHAFKSIQALEQQLFAEIGTYNSINQQRMLIEGDYQLLVKETAGLP